LKGPVGVFLKEFVENDVPWVHFDIACTAWGEKEKPYGPATGNVIRLVLDLLET
jgi:leucyl aminopeptidase